MPNYIVHILWVVIGGGVLNYACAKQKETVLGRQQIRWSKLSALLLVIPLIYWAGVRGNVADTPAYRNSFFAAPSNLSAIGDYLSSVDKDPGFSLFTALIKCIIGNRDILYFLIIASIQLICLCTVFRKYSDNYWLSIFLFVVATEYYSWMYNGMRQFLAVCVLFTLLGFFIRRKYAVPIIVILLISTIHQTALIMLPLMFLLRGKAWSKTTLLLLLGAIAAVFFAEEFTNILDNAMEETQYSESVSEWKVLEDDGANPIRVLVYSVPAILSFVFRKQIAHANDPLINFCVNASIVTSGLYLMSMATSGIMIGRLPIYTSLYNYILLPWIIQNCFTKNRRMYVWVAMIGLYTAYYLYSFM